MQKLDALKITILKYFVNFTQETYRVMLARYQKTVENKLCKYKIYEVAKNTV